MNSVEFKSPSSFTNQNICLHDNSKKLNQRQVESSFSTRLCDCGQREKQRKANPLFLMFPPQGKFRIQFSQEKKDELQTAKYLPQGKDPLWSRIYGDLVSMMGSSFSPIIKVCKLGAFHSATKSIDLYCQTEEAARFLKQFDYIILDSLQKYFPSIKILRIHKHAL